MHGHSFSLMANGNWSWTRAWRGMSNLGGHWVHSRDTAILMWRGLFWGTRSVRSAGKRTECVRPLWYPYSNLSTGGPSSCCFASVIKLRDSFSQLHSIESSSRCHMRHQRFCGRITRDSMYGCLKMLGILSQLNHHSVLVRQES